MKQGLQWYKRDPRAFLDGVQGMGPEMIGAYAVLLDLIYARGGDTPRDDRHLAGLLGCSARKARALTDALIEAGKIHDDGGFLTNSRAKSEAKSRRNEREARANAQRTRRERERDASENNDMQDKHVTSEAPLEKSREEYGGGDVRAREAPPPPEIAPPQPVPLRPPGPDPDDDLRDLLRRLPEDAGHDPAKRIVPSRWLESHLLPSVARWRDLGLTASEIVSVVRDHSPRDGPASSPAYYDRLMQRLAAEKARGALTPIDGGLSHAQRSPQPTARERRRTDFRDSLARDLELCAALDGRRRGG